MRLLYALAFVALLVQLCAGLWFLTEASTGFEFGLAGFAVVSVLCWAAALEEHG